MNLKPRPSHFAQLTSPASLHRPKLQGRLLHTVGQSKQQDLYTILGILPTATHQEVRAAFRLRALECHPDRLGPGLASGAGERFVRVREAYEVLKDSRSRGLYDIQRQSATPRTSRAVQQSWPGSSSSHGRTWKTGRIWEQDDNCEHACNHDHARRPNPDAEAEEATAQKCHRAAMIARYGPHLGEVLSKIPVSDRGRKEFRFVGILLVGVVGLLLSHVGGLLVLRRRRNNRPSRDPYVLTLGGIGIARADDVGPMRLARA
jgi:hypothetical protein